MCGRYTSRKPEMMARALEQFFQAEWPSLSEQQKQPRYNIAPTQSAAVVRSGKDGSPVLGWIRWGLIPSWQKEMPKLQPINARSETVATSGMFRQALQRRRCLVPADGFYEWHVLGEKDKRPVFLHKKDDVPYAYAGLWERWRLEGEESEPLDTFTIITTTANELMSRFHARMPVILAEENYARWLDRGVGSDDVMDLLKPADDADWAAYYVSKHVNAPRNDDASCVERESGDMT